MDKIDFESAFSQMPGIAALINVDGPGFTILACTDEFAQTLSTEAGQIVGVSLMDLVGNTANYNSEADELSWALQQVVNSGQPGSLPVGHLYPTLDKGHLIHNKPVKGIHHEVAAILHTIEKVTSDNDISSCGATQLHGFEQAFNLLIDAPHAVCVLSGPQLNVILANRTLLTLLCADEGIKGKPLAEVLPEKRRKNIELVVREVMKTGVEYEHAQARIRMTCEGVEREYYFHIICRPFFEPGEATASGVLVYGHDVTEKVSAISRLREKQLRYRTLIEEAPVATALYIGPEFHIQYINDTMLGYWGKDKSVVGMPIGQVFPNNEKPFLSELAWVFETGKSHIGTGIEASLHLNGKTVNAFFNCTFKPLRDQDGTIYGIHHTALDVTAQVLNQREVETSERKFRELSHSLEEKVEQRTFLLSQLNETFRHAERTGKFGSYRYNLVTGELTYSDNLYKLLGCEVQEFKPSVEEFMKFIHPEDRERASHDGQTFFLNGRSWDGDYRLVRKDGATIWSHCSSDRITASDGEEFLIGTLQDITQEKMREKQLTENNAKLSEMNRELESFAYISSHDLQEPLRKIQTFSSRIMVEEQQQLSDRAKGYFERITNAAQRMQILIDDLLAYSRTNVEDRNFERVHLSDLISEISQEIAEDLEVYHAIIETGKLCDVTIIPFQFRQLLHNLIGNALKFSRPEKLPHIYISSEVDTGAAFGIEKLDPDTNYCHIMFADNGIGFPPEFAEKIFEVFQRLHSREKYSGTGIGLAIVRKIVENHEGYIRASGEPNKGATFDIYIPDREF